VFSIEGSCKCSETYDATDWPKQNCTLKFDAYNFGENLVKSLPILKLFSPLERELNFQQNSYNISTMR